MISDGKSKYKSWSNLKKQMNDLLCDSLKDKISYFYTSYHEVHNAYGRATINYCKKEIVAFSWVEQYAQQRDIIDQYKKMENVPSALVDFEGSLRAYKLANTTATKEKWMPNCTLCEADFINSLTVYLKTDIATSLYSDNYLLRVFAYMDRRVGKRTLIKIREEVDALPEWVKQFYHLRCEEDSIVFPTTRITDESVVCPVRELRSSSVMEDWRLQGQENYLTNASLLRIRFPAFWQKAYQEKNTFYQKIADYAEHFVATMNRGQEYLEGEKIQHFWHQHCAFCWEKALTDKDCEFYCTPDYRYWICSNCFHDFREKFEWSIRNDDEIKRED